MNTALALDKQKNVVLPAAFVFVIARAIAGCYTQRGSIDMIVGHPSEDVRKALSAECVRSAPCLFPEHGFLGDTVRFIPTKVNAK